MTYLQKERVKEAKTERDRYRESKKRKTEMKIERATMDEERNGEKR